MDAKQTVLPSSRHRMYLPPPSDQSTSRLGESSQNKSPPAAQLSGRPAFSDPRAASQTSALSQAQAAQTSRQFTVVQERKAPLEILHPEQINIAHKDWPRIVESFSGCDPKFSLEGLTPTDLLRLATLLKTEISEHSDEFKAIAFSLFTTAIKSEIPFKSKHWAHLFIPSIRDKSAEKSIEECIHKDLNLLKNNKPGELAKRISLRLSQKSPHIIHDNMMLLHIITTPPEQWSRYRAQFLKILHTQCDTPGLKVVLEKFNHFQLSPQERAALLSKAVAGLTSSSWMKQDGAIKRFKDMIPSLIQSGLFDDPFLGESEKLLEELVLFIAHLESGSFSFVKESDCQQLGARIAEAIGKRTYQPDSIWTKHIFEKIDLYLEGEWSGKNPIYQNILKNLQFGPEILPADVQLELLCEVCRARNRLPEHFDFDLILAQFPAVSFDQFIQKLSHLLTTEHRLQIIKSSAALQKNPEFLERLAIAFSITGLSDPVHDLLVKLLPSPKTCVYDPETRNFFPKSVPPYFYSCIARGRLDSATAFMDLLERISPADREAIVECCKNPNTPMTASQSTIIDLIKIDIQYNLDNISMENLRPALKENISTLDATQIFEITANEKIDSKSKLSISQETCLFVYLNALLYSGWLTQQVQSTAFKSNQKSIERMIYSLYRSSCRESGAVDAGHAVHAGYALEICLFLLGNKEMLSEITDNSGYYKTYRLDRSISLPHSVYRGKTTKCISLTYQGKTFEIEEGIVTRKGAQLITLVDALLIAAPSIPIHQNFADPISNFLRNALLTIGFIPNQKLDTLLNTIQKTPLTPLLSRLHIGSLSIAQTLSALKDKFIKLKASGSINAENVLALETEYKTLEQTIVAINGHYASSESLNKTVQQAGKILINEKPLIDSVCEKLQNLEARLEIETDAAIYLSLKNNIHLWSTSVSTLAERIQEHGKTHRVNHLTPAQEQTYSREMEAYKRAMETYERAMKEYGRANERYNRDNAAALNWRASPLTHQEAIARSGHSYEGDGMGNYAQWSAMQMYSREYFETRDRGPDLPPRPTQPEKPSMPEKPENYEPYDHTSKIRNILTSMHDQLPD